MRPSARVSAVGAFVLLLLIGTFVEEDTRPMSPTTFGTLPQGYRAVFDLLTELGFPVRGAAGIPPRAPARDARTLSVSPAALLVSRRGLILVSTR
jgi:hypothetical protein